MKHRPHYENEMYLLTARELEFGSPQSLNNMLLVLGLRAHRHDDLSDVHAGHCALWLSKSTTHSSLEPGEKKQDSKNHKWRKKKKERNGEKKKKKKNPHMYTFPVVVRFCLNGPLKDPALHKLGSYTTKDALSAAFAHQSSIGNQAGRLNKLQLVVLCLTKLTYQLRHRTTFC